MIFSSLLSIRSHPMRVRGLKLLYILVSVMLILVAPHAGAWIETIIIKAFNYDELSHPMRVRGLKHNLARWRGYNQSRTPCGCVD